jgi:hypothetical protein
VVSHPALGQAIQQPGRVAAKEPVGEGHQGLPPVLEEGVGEKRTACPGPFSPQQGGRAPHEQAAEQQGTAQRRRHG